MVGHAPFEASLPCGPLRLGAYCREIGATENLSAECIARRCRTSTHDLDSSHVRQVCERSARSNAPLWLSDIRVENQD